MKKQTVLICALAAALLLALVKIVWTEPPASNPFVTKLPERVSLPSQDTSNEEFRKERFAEDGFTRIEAVREFRDGITETVKFRDDGTVSSYTELYPAGDSGTRQLKSNATFDESGRFFISHQVYRTDGTLERTGEQLRDGRYESKYYWDDGKTVARHRFFNKQRKFVSETVFSASGARLAVRTRTDEDLTTSLYREDGTLSASSVKTMFSEAGKVYAADGKLLFEFEETPWTTQEDHYNENGILVQGRVFVRMAGTTDIYMLNTDGTLRFKQVWRHSRKAAGDPVEPILSRIMEAKGKSLYRTIEVGKDGKPTSVEYPVSGGGKIVKELSDGKNVIATITYDRSNKVVSNVKASGEVENFDPAMLQDPPHAQRPIFVDENAPPMVYDYK